MKTSLRALIASLALASSSPFFAAETKIDPPDAAPVTIARAKQYDITSKINGRTYRVFVSTPYRAEEGKKYPVIYLFDGNWYFGPASINATESTVPAICASSPSMLSPGLSFPKSPAHWGWNCRNS